jgi:hypothetical protein
MVGHMKPVRSKIWTHHENHVVSLGQRGVRTTPRATRGSGIGTMVHENHVVSCSCSQLGTIVMLGCIPTFFVDQFVNSSVRLKETE